MADPRLVRGLVWSVGGFVALIVLSFVGCTLLHPDATTRLARRFDLGDVSTEDAIAKGLLAKVPVGTSEDAVGAFLTQSGIGKDGLSSWHPANGDGVIVCNIDYDVAEPAIVKESYCISFRLDEQRTLASVGVTRALTGP